MDFMIVSMIGSDLVSLEEYKRLENLDEYEISFTRSEPIFDQLAATAAKMLNVPMAMINFIGKQSVWRATSEKDASFEQDYNICSLALEKSGVQKFGELTKNPSHFLNPATLGEFGLRFFATVPIETKEGLLVGAIYVADSESRSFDSVQREKLNWVASMVVAEMNRRNAIDAVA